MVADDSEAERRDGEVVAAEPHGEEGEGQPGDAGARRAEDHGRPEAQAEPGHEERRDVGADPVEGRLPEVELAGVAEDEVEAECQHHVEGAHDHHAAPVGVAEDGGQERDHDEGRETQSPAPRGSRLRHFLLAARR